MIQMLYLHLNVSIYTQDSTFYIYLHIYYFQHSSFFMKFQISGWYHFSFVWRIPFISYSSSLLVINSFSFCVSSKIFILHSSLRHIFTGYRILEWQFFPSDILQKLFLTVNIFVPLCIMCLFFLLPDFKIFYFF